MHESFVCLPKIKKMIFSMPFSTFLHIGLNFVCDVHVFGICSSINANIYLISFRRCVCRAISSCVNSAYDVMSRVVFASRTGLDAIVTRLGVGTSKLKKMKLDINILFNVSAHPKKNWTICFQHCFTWNTL